MSTNIILPPAQGRAPRQSYEKHKQAIIDISIRHLRKYATENSENVTKRLARLENKWNIDRTLELNASIAASAGLLLGLFVNSKWFALSYIVLGFLFQHALQGRSPPTMWLRAYGWRNGVEIEDEAMALRFLHGRVVPSLAQAVKNVDKEQLLEDMEENKRKLGRFLAEGPNLNAEMTQKEE